MAACRALTPSMAACRALNATVEAQSSPRCNLQALPDSHTSPLLTPAPQAEFWIELLEELRTNFGIVFDEWQKDFDGFRA
jgi:hypothetical protein